MKKTLSVLLTVISMIFVSCSNNFAEENAKMKILKVKWQRLVYDGDKTCGRCRATGKEVDAAVRKLKSALKPLGIEVVLEETALDQEACAKDITQSNRIWLSGKPLEKWLNAKIGKSPCEACCPELGEKVECRTIKVNGKTYEEVPADLVIRAGLLAAASLMGGETPDVSCCPSKVKKSCKEETSCF